MKLFCSDTVQNAIISSILREVALKNGKHISYNTCKNPELYMYLRNFLQFPVNCSHIWICGFEIDDNSFNVISEILSTIDVKIIFCNTVYNDKETHTKKLHEQLQYMYKNYRLVSGSLTESVLKKVHSILTAKGYYLDNFPTLKDDFEMYSMKAFYSEFGFRQLSDFLLFRNDTYLDQVLLRKKEHIKFLGKSGKLQVSPEQKIFVGVFPEDTDISDDLINFFPEYKHILLINSYMLKVFVGKKDVEKDKFIHRFTEDSKAFFPKEILKIRKLRQTIQIELKHEILFSAANNIMQYIYQEIE